MEKMYQAIAAVVIALVIGVIGWQWIQTKKSEVQTNTIIRCGEIAAETGTEEFPFNGGVYQICMEDNGLETVVK